MKKIIFGLLCTTAAVAPSLALANACELTTTRYACPGKESESYAKCNGLQTCTITVETASLEECAAAALKSCENKRFDVTKYKAVTALYYGHVVEGGREYCDKDDGAYVVTKNFPYRNSEACE